MAGYQNYLRKLAERVLFEHFQTTGEKVANVFSQGALNKFLNHHENLVPPLNKIHTTRKNKKEPNISFRWANDEQTEVQIRGLSKFEPLFVTSKSIWKFLLSNGDSNPNKTTLLVAAKLFNALSQKEFMALEKDERERLVIGSLDNSNSPLSRKHWQFWTNAANKIKESGSRIEIYYNALRELPNNPQIIKNIAANLDDAGRFKEAEEFYLMGLEIAPNDADINSNYGLFLHRIRRDYNNAEKYFRKAYELSPRHVNNNAHYAWFLHQIRLDYKKAEEQYKIALDINPQNIYALNNYGCLLCFVKFEPENGIHFLKRAIEINPEHSWSLGNLGLAFTTYDMDKFLAEIFFKRATTLDPTNPFKQANYAQLLFVLGKDAEAMEHLEIAKQYAGGNLEILLEVELYLYAHCFEMNNKVEKNILELLGRGITSEKKNFTVNIKAAIKNGHPDVNTLINFAKEISGMNYDNFGQMIFPNNTLIMR